MILRTLFVIFILIFLSYKTTKEDTAAEPQKTELNVLQFPQQIGFVNDFEKIFTEENIKSLENILSNYKTNYNREIAIITIESIPENIDFYQYAIQISEHWKTGNDSKGNGLTIVLSKTLRKVRISTTGKTKALYLSDEFCEKVIHETMIPEFKKGNYYNGVSLGINKLIEQWI
ncbi:MAG: TPM domain-containing protein [Flavobacteriaceae bacterium]